MRYNAFTLIELLIAIILSILIAYVAFAAFKASSQAITVANRMALENKLLRSGFLIALNEVDTWVAYDDPQSSLANQQTLRNRQMPFSPLPELLEGRNDEEEIGWNATYSWPANDPRTWWRANPAEWHSTSGRSGNYAQFANTSSAPHLWLFRQMDMLQTNLSWYGFCDYLPPSMLYSYIHQGDLNPLFVTAGAFRNGDGGTWFSQGRYRCTKDTSYSIIPLTPKGGTAMIVPANFRRHWATGVGANETSINDFMNKTLSVKTLLDSKPEHWPAVKVETARFISHNRFVNLNTINLFNSLTGEQISLSFTAIGTTLMGARRMRKPGAPGAPHGWAKWYSPNNPMNDMTIDGKIH